MIGLLRIPLLHLLTAAFGTSRQAVDPDPSPT